MMKRKILATNELYHKLIGSVSTPEKFNAKRLHLAESVWQGLKETDSRECRNCHHFESMDFSAQKGRSGLVHKHAKPRNKTCIDCHMGIAHQLPDGVEVYVGGSEEDHEYYEEAELKCYQCHESMHNPENDDWDE